MKTSFKIRGVKEVQKYLKQLPYGVMKVALEAMAIYFIGDEAHGLKHSEPYKYVSRKSAYGVSFFTEKQRRWFWANGGPDMIGNNRTGESSKDWAWRAAGNGYQIKLENTTAGAYYTRDDYGQARQPAKVGWRKVKQVIADNIKGAMRSATAAINQYLKSKGK